MNFKIKLYSPNDACMFVNKCSLFDEDIDYCVDRYIISAKSMLGVLGIPLGKIATVKIHSEDESVIRAFKEYIQLWILEEE